MQPLECGGRGTIFHGGEIYTSSTVACVASGRVQGGRRYCHLAFELYSSQLSMKMIQSMISSERDAGGIERRCNLSRGKIFISSSIYCIIGDIVSQQPFLGH